MFDPRTKLPDNSPSNEQVSKESRALSQTTQNAEGVDGCPGVNDPIRTAADDVLERVRIAQPSSEYLPATRRSNEGKPRIAIER
jgi:hypothetical protein